MTLNEYISELQKLQKKHGTKQVVYAKDEEGNGFQPVVFAPSVGNVDGSDEFDRDGQPQNAVCVN